jgi:hypothetical protein
MGVISQVASDNLLSGLLGGLIGALLGYRAALAAAKLSERNAALAELKRAVIPFLRQIQAEERNCPSGTIEQCIAESEVLFQNCASMLRPPDARKLKRLWRDFKAGDQPEDTEGDTLMEYWSEANWESVRQNRNKALERLRAVITFQISA